MSEELSRVYASERERNRARKKRASIEELLATREHFFEGQFDAYVRKGILLTQFANCMSLRAILCHISTFALLSRII